MDKKKALELAYYVGYHSKELRSEIVKEASANGGDYSNTEVFKLLAKAFDEKDGKQNK